MPAGSQNWIWDLKARDNQTCQLWNAFEIPKVAKVTKARLVMTVDNEIMLHLDGHELDCGNEWREFHIFKLTKFLAPGLHVLAGKCYNSSEDTILAFGLLRLSSGMKLLVP